MRASMCFAIPLMLISPVRPLMSPVFVDSLEYGALGSAYLEHGHICLPIVVPQNRGISM